MEWQTKVNIQPADFRVGYGSEIMMLGSCFTENIGEKLSYFKFNTDINPCGIVYNPMSAASVLKRLVEGRPFAPEELIEHNGVWQSLLHHGSFSSSDKGECLRQINSRLSEAAGKLKTTDLLILTFGTAWVYRNREDGKVVSNCHKIPASAFERFRLKPEEIVVEYMDLIGRLREINPKLKVVFTVSPIRHWKDGAHGNQLSKSTLLLAIDSLAGSLERVYYFPSYEIVMDELRDYRFYAEDMLHVTPQTVEYIWNRFKETYIDKKAEYFMVRIDKINKALAHRPSEAGNEKWLQLCAGMLKEMEKIENEIRSSVE